MRPGIHLWDVPAGTPRIAPVGHTAPPQVIRYSPDGRRLATGGGKELITWDPKTGEALARIHRQESVRTCAFSFDGRLLFSCWTGTEPLVVSDASTGRELQTLQITDREAQNVKSHGWSLSSSPDGRKLIVLSDHAFDRGPGQSRPVHLVTGFDTESRQQLFQWRRERTSSIVIAPDLTVMAADQPGLTAQAKAVEGRGAMQLLEAATGKSLFMFPGVEGQTRPVVFSPDGRLLVSKTYHGANLRPENTVRLWEIATASPVLDLPTVLNPHVAFTRDNRMMATVTPKNEILLWDLRRGKEVGRILEFPATVTSLAFAPDAPQLVSGLSDSTVLIWDAMAFVKAEKPSPLDAAGAAQAWTDLGASARKAFAARGQLADAPDVAVALLMERLKPAQPLDPQRFRQLLTNLDSNVFAVREEARQELEALDSLAEKALRRALTEKTTLEFRRRVERVLEKLRDPLVQPELLRSLRAVAVLEDIGTPAAQQLLRALANGAPEARLTTEAKASLERLMNCTPRQR